MRKQTKLVAVLSAAALLAIGASMTSFAATGWAEENGTWVYYDRDGSKVSDEWKKSGSNWFYLDSDGSMATNALIEDDDNYYYVSADGAMVGNQWVAIENEDAGDDDEPESYWYYFQANGKAYKAGSGDNAYFRTINGKKYVFNDDGEMQFGWVDESGERQTGDDAWKEAEYYCGDENDGAQATGWKLIHILDEDWDPDSEVNGDLFDEEQDRWFYFKTNGKRYENEEKTINGKKYRFDEEGRMVAEWFTVGTPTTLVGTPYQPVGIDGTTTIDPNYQGNPGYTTTWRYYGSPEDGARVTKGWFQVVSSEYLNSKDYDDSDESWYYSDGNGKLVANEFKTINGKKYAFDSYGRMVDGLRLIATYSANKNKILDVYDDDHYDDEDKFESFFNLEGGNGWLDTTNNIKYDVNTYYFGDKNDGSMKTGKMTINLDGDDLSFYFEKSGSKKGRGIIGKDDSKYYLGGKLFKADRDEKYEFIVEYNDGRFVKKLNGADLMNAAQLLGTESSNGKTVEYLGANQTLIGKLNAAIVAEDPSSTLRVTKVYTINTAGSVVSKKSKCKTGDDMIFNVEKDTIVRIYEEN